MQGLIQPLGLADVEHILPLGGTILRTSRTNPYRDGGAEQVKQTLVEHGVDALIAIGGEDTLGVARRLNEDGLFVVGVPKTIDNDLSGTDVCFGFDTAVSIATEAVDRLHSTAESHNRILVCEVMGRDAGWIAITAGLAGGADVILVPEVPIDIEEACRLIKYRWEHGKKFSIVVVAEGAKFPEGELATHDQSVDSFGHVRLAGIGQAVAEAIEKRTGYETRSVNLGHTQRGGTPTAYDRMLATRYGTAAIDLVHAGKFNRLVVLKGTQISDIPLADAIAKTRTVGEDLLNVMKGLQPPR